MFMLTLCSFKIYSLFNVIFLDILLSLVSFIGFMLLRLHEGLWTAKCHKKNKIKYIYIDIFVLILNY